MSNRGINPEPWLADPDVTLYHGDVLAVLRELPAESVDCCVTSPPYWGLRDYGQEGQLGLEPTPEEYVTRMVEVFREVRRVLRSEATVWINIGDTRRDKQLVGVPWRLAFALQGDGWLLRSDLIWAKRNCMPEPVTDRPTQSHEYLFLLAKRPKYFFDQDAVREPHESDALERTLNPRHGFGSGKGNSSQRTIHAVGAHPNGRNIRSVWSIATNPYPGAHFAPFPEELALRCISAGCPLDGSVLDPFVGSGTTCVAARKIDRHSIGIDLNESYLALAARRLQQQSLFAESAS